MTIDEAIKHCEEVASQCEFDTDWGIGNNFIDRSGVIDVIECGAEHRQLAEWLRELKDIKHLFSITEKLFKANFRGGLIDVVDGYDILFSEHKQLREIFEEVTADE